MPPNVKLRANRIIYKLFGAHLARISIIECLFLFAIPKLLVLRSEALLRRVVADSLGGATRRNFLLRMVLYVYYRSNDTYRIMSWL